jgi:hypothetical protein
VKRWATTTLLIVAGLLVLTPVVAPTISTYILRSIPQEAYVRTDPDPGVVVVKYKGGTEYSLAISDENFAMVSAPRAMFVGDTAQIAIEPGISALIRKHHERETLPPSGPGIRTWVEFDAKVAPGWLASIEAPGFYVEKDNAALGASEDRGVQYSVTPKAAGLHSIAIIVKGARLPSTQRRLPPLRTRIKINVVSQPEVSLPAISTFLGILTALSAMLGRKSGAPDAPDDATTRLLKQIAKKRKTEK